MSVSKTILIGNVGNDPETRYLPNGNAVCNFSLATSEKWKDKTTGQYVEKTEWHRISMFGKIAEIAGQYLKKGSKVYIEGRNQTREWEKDGVKRYTTEVVVDMRGAMQMLDGKPSDGQQAPQQRSQDNSAQQRQSQQSQQTAVVDDYDDFSGDIPF